MLNSAACYVQAKGKHAYLVLMAECMAVRRAQEEQSYARAEEAGAVMY